MTEVMKSAIVTENSVTVVVDGNTRSITDSHPNYEGIRTAVRAQDWDAIPDLLDVLASVKRYVSQNEDVVVDQEYGRAVVRYKGSEVGGYVSNRIRTMMNEQLPVEPLVNFLEKVKMNTSRRAVEDLLEFLEKSGLPITPEGYILAYKNVRKDFLDMYTGTMDNSPGKVVEVERNEVNEDPDQTCSFGLHFCAQSYLSSYGGDSGNTVIVKIHPKDVVAFPRDYNMAKGRTCRYEVIGLHTKGVANSAFSKSVEAEPGTEGYAGSTVGVGSIVSKDEAARFWGITVSAVRKRCATGYSGRWAGSGKVEILRA